MAEAAHAQRVALALANSEFTICTDTAAHRVDARRLRLCGKVGIGGRLLRLTLILRLDGTRRSLRLCR